MKIILSRKGLDSSTGGFPSPILPDNRLCWIPIPGGRRKDLTYSELKKPKVNIGDIVGDLSNSMIFPYDACHLDPDLNRSYAKRANDWRGAFGQCSAAQSHLDSNLVGVGDLFLFFGWFRKAEFVKGYWRFARNAPNIHVIYGWLQVGEKYCLKNEWRNVPKYGQSHTHFVNRHEHDEECDNNTLFIGANKISLSKESQNTSGYGQFPLFNPSLCLTCQTSPNRALWELPAWFYPDADKKPLSYHGDIKRWTKNGKTVLLQSVGRGQEFVLDCDHYPEAANWALNLIKSNI
jgi:hypothetical protein